VKDSATWLGCLLLVEALAFGFVSGLIVGWWLL